ncbi:hypothetical protein B0H19DRAFT_205851 [Mycena capillaripes]|nr:hypothetical protein B0H19DRAFT_205851 [Mycena capillaripes]
MTLDSRIQAAIRSGAQLSQPHFGHYLSTMGLGRRIKESDLTRRANYHLTGELAMHMCLVRYFLDNEQRLALDSNAHALVKTRILSPDTYALLLVENEKLNLRRHSDSFLTYCMIVFVGTLANNLSFDETYEWFKLTFGPLIDRVAAVYAEYTDERDRDNCERLLLQGDIPTPKRARRNDGDAKPLYSQAVIDFFSELEVDGITKAREPFPNLEPTAVVAQGAVPLSSPSLFPKNLADFDFSTLFRASPIVSTAAQRFPLARGKVHTFIRSFGEYTQREVFAFKSTAFPDGSSMLYKISGAFYEGFMSALTANAGHLSPSPSPSMQSLSSGHIVEQRKLSYHRARAPSPPSPASRLQHIPQVIRPSLPPTTPSLFSPLNRARLSAPSRPTFFPPVPSDPSYLPSKPTPARAFKIPPGAFFSPSPLRIGPHQHQSSQANRSDVQNSTFRFSQI